MSDYPGGISPEETAKNAFSHDQYLLKRQALALTGKVRVYDPMGALALYVEQKMFRLREDIRIYADEGKNLEMLWIQARQVIDFAAAYDVVDSREGVKVGALRRKGFRSIVRDAWEILDSQDQVIGVLREESARKALLRRLLLGTLLPQGYDVLLGEAIVARFQQRFHLFRYEMDLDFSPMRAVDLDRRLGLSAAVLLAVIEGRQSN
jgi:uncharacterized protein YxjI